MLLHFDAMNCLHALHAHIKLVTYTFAMLKKIEPKSVILARKTEENGLRNGDRRRSASE